jgi:hypothetical protein
MVSERLMRLMGGNSRAASGFRILRVDIDDILMLFPCCRFELCVPGTFETERNSQLIPWCFDYDCLGRDMVGS